MKIALGKKDKFKYYRLHQDYGNNIEDCYDLKENIKELIHNGYLERFI